jgi:hypothetical protein
MVLLPQPLGYVAFLPSVATGSERGIDADLLEPIGGME